MPFKAALCLHLVPLTYGALMYRLGPVVPIATIALGFGLLIIPYLLLEWVVTPGIAVLMGFQARWRSVPSTLILGGPLVLLFTLVTPVVSAGSEGMGVPVPWLAVYANNKESIIPIIHERLVWWGLAFAASAIAGRMSNFIWKPRNGDQEP